MLCGKEIHEKLFSYYLMCFYFIFEGNIFNIIHDNVSTELKHDRG